MKNKIKKFSERKRDCETYKKRDGVDERNQNQIKEVKHSEEVENGNDNFGTDGRLGE